MRICDLTNFYHGKSGGVKTYLHQKMAYLARFRSDEHLVIVPGPANAEEKYGRSTICRVRAPELPGSGAYRLIFNTGRVNALIREFRPEIVELGCPYFLPWALAARRRYGFRLTAFYHSDFPHALARSAARLAGKIPGALLEKSAAAYVRAMYRRTDLTLAPSLDAAARLSSLGIPGVQVIPLGVDLEHFHPRHRRLRLRLRLGLSSQQVLLLYVGRFTREKGLDVLRRAFESLTARNPGRYHLLLIGEGPLGDELRNWAANRGDVTVGGYLQGKQLAEVYASADIFVTAGWAETFGLTILEAQASGLPVAAVTSGAARQTVAPEAGFLVEANDPLSFAAAVARLAGRDFRTLGCLARQYVEVNFGWEKTFCQLFSLYEKLLTNRLRTRPETPAASGATGRRIARA
ncbi:MAG: glycosyltransferase [Moorella sp. (in: Bacteria)]|nr:glycosyltransferase [Moorella sp. (in: firmicutes)]